MARLIFSEQIEESNISDCEREVCDFIKRKLPDYIYAVYGLKIKDKSEIRNIDIMLLVPHMGVYVIKILDTVDIQDEDGVDHSHFTGYSQDENENRMNRKWIKSYIKRRFNIEPLVYDMLWLPNVALDVGIKMVSGERLAEKIIFHEDMNDFIRFTMKLQMTRAHMYDLYPPVWGMKYDDLTDTMAHNIYFYWKKGMPVPNRPEKPPLVFMSYNQLNQVVAGEIKADIENRGIFVWRAPEDVTISGYYKKEETAAIQKCDAFLILLSSSSQESDEVRYEFETAVQMNKKILPLWIEDCKINDYYQQALVMYQYRLMSKPDSQIMDEIEKVIRSVESEP